MRACTHTHGRGRFSRGKDVLRDTCSPSIRAWDRRNYVTVINDLHFRHMASRRVASRHGEQGTRNGQGYRGSAVPGCHRRPPVALGHFTNDPRQPSVQTKLERRFSSSPVDRLDSRGVAELPRSRSRRKHRTMMNNKLHGANGAERGVAESLCLTW